MRILFVCSGNICRSAMAEIILREELVRSGVEGVEVRSAGLMACSGEAISRFSATVLAEEGYPAGEAFLSTAMGGIDPDAFDWIVCMTSSHVLVLEHRFPETKANIRTLALRENGAPKDIADPYGGSLQDYRKSFEEIKESVGKLMVELMERREV